jgi:hypothetical protein
MTDGFNFRVTFGTGEKFSRNVTTGDRDGFLEACGAVKAVAAGKDEWQIRELLAGEFRSRGIDIDLFPDAINVLAGVVADNEGSITVGDWEDSEEHEPDILRPGLIGRLVGRVIGRVLAPDAGQMMREGIAASPVASRIMGLQPADPRRYVPEPGQEPSPAEVIADPDLPDRLPRLLTAMFDELPDWPVTPPAMPRSGTYTSSFSAALEEEGGMVFVRRSGERIGRLNPADAQTYAAHLKAARLHDQFVPVTVTARMKRGRPSHITVRLGGVFG